jgi:hypothetical protein
MRLGTINDQCDHEVARGPEEDQEQEQGRSLDGVDADSDGFVIIDATDTDRGAYPETVVRTTAGAVFKVDYDRGVVRIFERGVARVFDST